MRCACLVLLALSEVTAVTKVFHRPEAAQPLSRAEALARLAESHGRRLQDGAQGVDAEFRDAWMMSVADPVQQVHIAPGRPGEAVVTWLTDVRGASSVVHYAAEGGYVFRKADGEAKVYSTQICLPNSDVMHFPRLGPPNHPINLDKLTALLNTSAFLPPESDSFLHMAAGESPWDVIAKTNFCVDYKNPTAYYTSPYIHTTVITGLKPRTSYTFRPEASHRSFRFRTPAAPGEAPFRLGVWADVGITNISFSVMQEMLRLDPELVLTVGDLSYADGWGPRWDIFGVMMEPLLATRFHLAVVGNHEITQNNGVDFSYRYPMPSSQSGSESPFMFCHESGPLYIIGTPGSYAGTEKASVQWNFVAEKLQRVNRERTPWVVVMFHTPWYSSNKCHYGEGLKHQWDMEDLLQQYGVDLVFNGHIHSYERSFPVFKNSRHECGTTHIVIGDGGNYEGPATYEGDPPGWQVPQPDWSAFREAAYGPGVLTVFNSTHAEWEWYRVACVFENKNAQPIKSDHKYSYGGSRQSLGRTRPLSKYVWDGVSGPEGGPKCATDGDDSEQRFATGDKVMLVRNPEKCPNKAAGDPTSHQAIGSFIGLENLGGFTARGQEALFYSGAFGLALLLLGLVSRRPSRSMYQELLLSDA